MNKQRAKMALIPVLAGALWMVLREPSAETATARPRRPEIPVAEPGVASHAGRSRNRSLAEIVSFDPFAPPLGLDSRASPAGGAAATGTADVDTSPGLPLRSRLRIEAIHERDGAFQAVIAGKVVRPGDVVDGGRYRVTAITADDVTFNRIDAAQNP
jgi:hypothetical protein